MVERFLALFDSGWVKIFLHDAWVSAPVWVTAFLVALWWDVRLDRKSTRLNSSHLGISYAVFCLKKKILVMEGLAKDEYPHVARTDVKALVAGPQKYATDMMRCALDSSYTAVSSAARHGSRL